MRFTRRKFIRLTSGSLALQLMDPVSLFAGAASHTRIALTEEALRIHQEALVVDGHNDMPGNILDKKLNLEPGFTLNKIQPGLQTDIPRLRKGGVDAQVFVAYISPDYIHTGGGNLACLEQIELIHHLVATHGESLELALSSKDIPAVSGKGKIAVLIGVEGGHAMENDLKNLERYYELGARYMTLTHNENTDWADAAYAIPKHMGLTSFGEEVIKAMNDLGMLVDVSHAADDTVRDVLKVSKAPVIASHSSAHAISPCRRNLKDQLIRGIAGTGGIVMVNFFPVFLMPGGEKIEAGFLHSSRALEDREQEALPPCYVGHLVDHIDHLVKVASIDHVGLGSDYDGITYGPEQMADVSGFPYITQELLNRGYSQPEIRKILGENFIRVLSEAQK